MPRNNVFISYARTDESFARQIASLLSKEGLSVWIDVEDIPAGERWSNAIQQGLQTAEVMLLIVTPESMASKNVADEWMYFRDKDKPIIPVILRPAEIHYRLSSLQWVDFSEPGSHFLSNYARLRAELERIGSELSSAVGQAPYTIKSVPPVQSHSHEEERRLDAAMPRQVSVNQPTEVWIQLCLPGSRGFRDKLPHFTEQGDVISQADVREHDLNVQYPLDPVTQQPVPVYVMVELRGADFEIADPDQQVMLTPGKDSPLLVFGATPTAVRSRSVLQVIVTLTTPDGQMVTVGSGALATEVLAVGVERAAQVVWGFISRQLGKVVEGGKSGAAFGGALSQTAEPPPPPRPIAPPAPIITAPTPAPIAPAASAPVLEEAPPEPVALPDYLPDDDRVIDMVDAEPEFVKPVPAAPSRKRETLEQRLDDLKPQAPPTMAPQPQPHAAPKRGLSRHVLIVAAVVGLLLILLLAMTVTNTLAPGSAATDTPSLVAMTATPPPTDADGSAVITTEEAEDESSGDG
jgi:hypothetical protein